VLFIKPAMTSRPYTMLLIHALFSSEALMVLAVHLRLGKMPLYHPTWAILPHNVQEIQVNFLLFIYLLLFCLVILMSYMCRV